MRNFNSLIVSASLNLTGLSGVLFVMHNSYRIRPEMEPSRKSALPFYSYFTDENGYLFVMTYEPGKKPGEYLYEVISPEGKLVNRISLGPYFSSGNILAKVYRHHLYLVREKESGEKELVVYKIY